MNTFSRAAKVVFMSCLLGGCSSLVDGNSSGGIIDNYSSFDRGAAFRKAGEHCHQFGRIAKIDPIIQHDRIIFECVAPQNGGTTAP